MLSGRSADVNVCYWIHDQATRISSMTPETRLTNMSALLDRMVPAILGPRYLNREEESA